MVLVFQSVLIVFFSSHFMWKFEEGEVLAAFHNSVDELALGYMEELEAPLVMPEVNYCVDLEDYALTTEFV